MSRQDTHSLSGQKIIVVGAGLAGLAFAVALRGFYPSHSTAAPPQLVIYERDNEENAIGREGYSMSLRSDAPGGLQALQKLGVLDDVVRASVSVSDNKHGSGFNLWDREMNTILRVQSKVPQGLSVGHLRIARDNLRRVLTDATRKAGCDILWDSGCAGIRRREDGRLELKLMDGSVDTCDLLVASDGASSKIRAELRPDDKLIFRNLSLLCATSRYEDTPPKPVNKDWGMVNSETTKAGLFISPVDLHSALWSLSFPSQSPREKKKHPLSDSDKSALLNEAREYKKDFPPLFSKLIDATDESTLMLFNVQDKLPFAHTNQSFPDVIFIGDANHAVSPFAGNGANMALCDGCDLAEILCTSDSIAQALKKYDDLVVPRSTKVLKQSHQNMDMSQATGWKLWLRIVLFRIVSLFVMNRFVLDHPLE